MGAGCVHRLQRKGMIWPPVESFEINRQTLPRVCRFYEGTRSRFEKPRLYFCTRSAIIVYGIFVSSLYKEDSLTGQSDTYEKIQDSQAAHEVFVCSLSRASLSIYKTLRPEQQVPFRVCDVQYTLMGLATVREEIVTGPCVTKAEVAQKWLERLT